MTVAPLEFLQQQNFRKIISFSKFFHKELIAQEFFSFKTFRVIVLILQEFHALVHLVLVDLTFRIS